MAELTFNRSAITKDGGQKWAYKRVQEDGSDLSQADTWHDGVYREKSTFEWGRGSTPIIDESGQQVATDLEEVKTSWSITSLQDDAATETFLKDETQGTYFAIFMNAGEDSDSKIKERFIAIATIDSSYKSDSPGRRPEIKIIPQCNATAITPASVPTWAKAAASAYIVAAEKYYTVKST